MAEQHLCVKLLIVISDLVYTLYFQQLPQYHWLSITNLQHSNVCLILFSAIRLLILVLYYCVL